MVLWNLERLLAKRWSLFRPNTGGNRVLLTEEKKNFCLLRREVCESWSPGLKLGSWHPSVEIQAHIGKPNGYLLGRLAPALLHTPGFLRWCAGRWVTTGSPGVEGRDSPALQGWPISMVWTPRPQLVSGCRCDVTECRVGNGSAVHATVWYVHHEIDVSNHKSMDNSKIH